MKQYSFWQAIVMSFYSRDLYRDVALHWGANPILYLLWLLVLCWIPLILSAQIIINATLNDSNTQSTFNQIVAEVPEIRLNENGTITTPENRPYLVHSPTSKKVIAVIDTTGQYTTLEKQPYLFLVTKTTVMDRKDDGTIELRTIPKGSNFLFDPHVVVAKIQSLAKWLWVFMFPLAVVAVFIGRLVQGLIYALFGKVMSLIVNVALPYSTIFMLTLVALTPVLIISTVMDIVFCFTTVQGGVFNHLGLLYFTIAMFYLFFAINSNNRT